MTFQVVACDVQSVANEILHGVEDALAVKKREYVQTANINLVRFSNEVNIVVRYVLPLYTRHEDCVWFVVVMGAVSTE